MVSLYTNFGFNKELLWPIETVCNIFTYVFRSSRPIGGVIWLQCQLTVNIDIGLDGVDPLSRDDISELTFAIVHDRSRQVDLTIIITFILG